MEGRPCGSALRYRPLGSPAAPAGGGDSEGRAPRGPVTYGAFLCPPSTIQSSVALPLAASCLRHSQMRPPTPTHTGEGCGQGHPGGAGGTAEPLNGPIEAQAG